MALSVELSTDGGRLDESLSLVGVILAVGVAIAQYNEAAAVADLLAGTTLVVMAAALALYVHYEAEGREDEANGE